MPWVIPDLIPPDFCDLLLAVTYLHDRILSGGPTLDGWHPAQQQLSPVSAASRQSEPLSSCLTSTLSLLACQGSSRPY